MEHRHVCIAAGDFCLIWSSHTAMQCFCYCHVEKELESDTAQEKETEAPMVPVQHTSCEMKGNSMNMNIDCVIYSERCICSQLRIVQSLLIWLV